MQNENNKEREGHRLDSSEPVRTAVRFPLRLPVRLQTSAGEVAATTENVSAGGCCS